MMMIILEMVTTLTKVGYKYSHSIVWQGVELRVLL